MRNFQPPSTPQQYLRGIRLLERACLHLEDQYSPRLTPTDAVNHFQSRSLLLKQSVQLHNEALRRFPEMGSTPITQAEIYSAVQQARKPGPQAVQ